jgi:hypothetical protein
VRDPWRRQLATITNFGIWRDAVRGRPATTYPSFPSLNHLFVSGSGMATPAEYAQPRFVAEEVLETIARWIGYRQDAMVPGQNRLVLGICAAVPDGWLFPPARVVVRVRFG